MSETGERTYEGLSEEELAAERATELPARQAMSSIGDVSIPFDPHAAADVLLGDDQGIPAPEADA